MLECSIVCRTKAQSARFLSSRPNCVPQSLTRKQVAPPPLVPRGETPSFWGIGWGDPIPTKEHSLWYSMYTINPSTELRFYNLRIFRWLLIKFIVKHLNAQIQKSIMPISGDIYVF
jgi:hypothetical protein